MVTVVNSFQFLASLMKIYEFTYLSVKLCTLEGGHVDFAYFF